MNKNYISNLKSIFIYLLLILTLQGCSAYKNKFACNPATGANCQSVEEIQSMLENGKIWELNGRKKICTGKHCSKTLEEIDRIASHDGILKVWIPENYRMQEYRDGQYWYLPASGV